MEREEALYAQKKNPVSKGRAFRGWYTEPETLNAYDFDTPVDHAMILYAGWDQYWSVTFEGGANRADNNLSLPESQSVLNGTAATDPWVGMTIGTSVFVGWTTDYEGLHPYDFTSPVTGNLTLYAQWHSTRCTVTIHANGHGFDRDIVLTEGETLAQPDDPSDTFYTHQGWFTEVACLHPYDFSLPVTGTLDLYSKWAVNPVMRCVYNDDQGTENRYWFRYGTRFTPPAPEWAGHSFQGWYLDEALTVPFTGTETFLEDVTLYADWTLKRLQVTFDSCGGSAVPTQVVNYGARITEPADPVRDGFVFCGWYFNDSYTWNCGFYNYNPDTGLNNLSSFPVTEATTLYALWEPEGSVPISEDRFPDEALRTYVSTTFDVDGDGLLLLEEREAVTSINLNGLRVTDTTGLRWFPNLTELKMQGPSNDTDYQVTRLDLSGLDHLRQLDVRSCGLSYLSLGYKPELTHLYCQGNRLTYLDVTAYDTLEVLYVYDNPDLVSLEVGPNVRTLYCYQTSVTTLDLIGSPYLQYLA